MRNNVETRRCGCGQFLGLREGCQRCADAARAKLHAAGVCASESDELPRPFLPPPGGTFSNLPVTVKHERKICMDCGSLVDRNALGEVTTRLPAIGGECSWDVAKAHMEAEPSAKYGTGSAYEGGARYGLFDGELMCATASGWKTSMLTDASCGKARWVRLA